MCCCKNLMIRGSRIRGEGEACDGKRYGHEERGGRDRFQVAGGNVPVCLVAGMGGMSRELAA